MICFEIELNGKRLCVAGHDDTEVLSSILSWVKRENEFALSIGGLIAPAPDASTHVQWTDRDKLKVGDEIRIKIIESETADEPTRVNVTTAEETLEQERCAYATLKAKFEQEGS